MFARRKSCIPESVIDAASCGALEKIVGEIKKVEKDVLTIETTYSDSDFKIVGSDCVY